MDERIRSFITEYGVILVLAVAGVVFLAFGIAQLTNSSDQVIISSESSNEAASTSETGQVYVDVAGAVVHPGLYKLSANARIADAIDKAGGVTQQADENFLAQVLNRAQLVEDGQKIFIPSKSEEVAGTSTVQSSASQSNRININMASSAELDTLPGVGGVTAQKIIAGRPYSSVPQLKSKKAVSDATFEKIKDLITVF